MSARDTRRVSLMAVAGWRRELRRALAALLVIIILLPLPGDVNPGPPSVDLILSQITSGSRFELARWEAQAVSRKVKEAIIRPEARLSPDERRDLVEQYFASVAQIARLQWEMELVYANPTVVDAKAAAAPLQAEIDALQADQVQRIPAVQRIIEAQIAGIAAEVGLTNWGMVWPPVSFQFTESPAYLIVSPRERIVLEHGVYLTPDVDLALMTEIETRVETRLERSALVEGTGGFSSYPTMIIETPDLSWVLSTVAHEWGHTYLFFRPLGWHYYDSGDMRTFNETAVSILGDEIGRLLIARFYPEWTPVRDWPRPLSMDPNWWHRSAEPESFEFGAFMRETRLQVDKYLASGQVTEAEAYMELRRQQLVARGYNVRRINQAYFAFHGSYAVGTGATDPIGGKLRALRSASGSLSTFLRAIERMTSVAQLDAALALDK